MSTTTSKTSKATALASVQALINGTNKRFPNGTFSIGNTTYTTAALVQLLESLAHAITAVNAAEATTADAVVARRGIEAKVNPVIRDYRRFLRVSFGTATEALADFGLTPPKARAPRTSEQKAAAAAKLRATRAARGTASKKQKATIKGKVTGVAITPIVEAAAAPPATTPATTSSAQPAPGASNVPGNATPTK
jgi:hypothetical protein